MSTDVETGSALDWKIAQRRAAKLATMLNGLALTAQRMSEQLQALALHHGAVVAEQEREIDALRRQLCEGDAEALSPAEAEWLTTVIGRFHDTPGHVSLEVARKLSALTGTPICAPVGA